MNQEIAKFCSIQWHKEIKTESNLSCSCGRTYAFSAPAHKEFIDSIANSELHKKFACANPDFTTPAGYALLHTAMGGEVKWETFKRWYKYSEYCFLNDESTSVAGCEFHERPFPEQAKIIYEFIKEVNP